MIVLSVTTRPSGEALVFIGLLVQAFAVYWLWQDWQFSQWQHTDWRKYHQQTETQTLATLATLWDKFEGAAAAGVDWESQTAGELDNLVKLFPALGDGDELKKRKINAITQRYGVGPDDKELREIRGRIGHLAVIRRGVADYRTFTRKKTFGAAVKAILLGFLLQIIGSWPTSWTVSVTTLDEPAAKEAPPQPK